MKNFVRTHLYWLIVIPIIMLTVLLVFGPLAPVLPGPARAEAAPAASAQAAWPAEVSLPAGRKLVSVSWLCHSGCEPWFVTRTMRAGEAAESYTLSNGRDSIVVRETAPSR